MKTSTVIIVAVVVIALLMFVMNMFTYDSENDLAIQCKNAGGEMSAVITPVGVFQYCDGLHTGTYFFGSPCCSG